ncbi:DUF2917 domain-containing protein [Aquabacterium humicola]|uniref:DUF2917 domain-containing protein n=1 Tax=Aquabacterium humicola TaxID=3237377 RepID=UPI0025432312|nr:DUF2917 domain-containing protein [Rubrivivax pictus]
MTAAATTSAAPRHLPRRGLFKLPDAAGVQIECRSGSLWITLDDDPRDFVIEAGERFVTDEHKPVIVYALRAAELQVQARDEGPSRARWTPRPGPARTAAA